MLRGTFPWVARGINIRQLSTKSQHKQQGDHLFSSNRGTVTYRSEPSPPSPWSLVSGLLRVNLHFLPRHLLTFNKILLWVTCAIHVSDRSISENITAQSGILWLGKAFLIGILSEKMLWQMNAILDGKTIESLKCLLLIISNYHYYFSNSSVYVAKHYTVGEYIPRPSRFRMVGFTSFSLQGCELRLYRNSTGVNYDRIETAFQLWSVIVFLDLCHASWCSNKDRTLSHSSCHPRDQKGNENRTWFSWSSACLTKWW